MRTKARWEIRHTAWATWRELVKVHPQLFKRAGPSRVYSESTTRTEPVELQKLLEGANTVHEAISSGA